MKRSLLGLVWVLVSVVAASYAVTDERVISALESNRISIFFVADSGLLAAVISLAAYAVASHFKQELFKAVALYTMIAAFSVSWVVSWNYGNTSRQSIGYFYRIPAGEYVDYPKRSRIEHNQSLQSTPKRLAPFWRA